jgi:hypothetical protein
MKRVLSLVLALVLVLGTIVPAFAEDTAAEKTAGEILKGYGVIEGTDEGLEEDQSLTRAELAVVLARLNGKADDAQAYPFKAPDKYTDLDENAWYYKWVAYAISQEWMGGTSDTTFAPDEIVNAQTVNTVVVEALGFTTEWATVNDQAAELGVAIVAANAAEALRGELFTSIVKALDVDYKDTEETLGTKLALTGYEAPKPAEPEKLMVTAVSASNLKEVVVNFNGTVEAKSAKTLTNYKVGNANPTAAKVLEDGKTVVLTVATLTNQTEATIKVSGVKNAAEVAMDAYTTKFTPFDATLPQVQSVEFTGPKTFTIKMSEPMNTDGTVTVKSNNSSLSVDQASTVVNTADATMIDVVLYSTLTDGTDYVISLTGAADFAGYQNIAYKESMTYTKSADLPTAEVTEATQKVVTVKFDKPVSGLTKEHFYHTFTGWTAKEIFEDSALTNTVTSSEKVSTVYVQFATTGTSENPLPAGDVEFHIKAKAGSEIKDNWGNKFAGADFTVEITADRTAPEVEKVEVVSGTSLKVTFNEAIGNIADATYTLLDTDGEKVSVTITATASASKKVATLTLSASQASKVRTIKIEGIKDDTLYTNAMSTFTQEVSFGDKAFAGVERVEYDATNKLLYVIYKEDMAENALTLTNYQIDTVGDGSEYITLEGPASFFDGNKVVKFELSTTEDGKISTSSKVLIANVTDVAGNASTPIQTTNAVVAIGTVPPTIKTIKAVAKDKLEVQFDQTLVKIDLSEFKVVVDANNNNTADDTAITITGIETALNSTGTLATLTLGTKVDADPSANNPTTTLDVRVTTAFTAAKTANVFGTAPTNATDSAVTDKIVPALALNGNDKAMIETHDENADGIIDAVILTYDEDINAATVSLLTYTIDSKLKIDSIYVADSDATNSAAYGDATPGNGKKVVIKLNANDTAGDARANDTGLTPKVTQALAIQDVAGNEKAAVAAATALDMAAPVIIKADATATSANLVVTFSEKVVGGDGTTAATLAYADFNYTDPGTADVTGFDGGAAALATSTDGVTTVTLVMNQAFAQVADIDPGDETLNAVLNSVYDVAGNVMAVTTKAID